MQLQAAHEGAPIVSKRQLVLDVETTGLKVEDGHRVIDLACVELIDREPTGSVWQSYFNPDCESDDGALAVHGLTQDFLADKPLFEQKASSLLDYIGEDDLIIHNAPFDLAFVNAEFMRVDPHHVSLQKRLKVIDTLVLARQHNPYRSNKLDNLCRIYGVDNRHRDKHGALIDSLLLADVYLKMTTPASKQK